MEKWRELRKPSTTHTWALPHRELDPILSVMAGLDRFPLGGFKRFSLSLQSPFRLSLAVLVRYRSLISVLALGGVHHPVGTAIPSSPTPEADNA